VKSLNHQTIKTSETLPPIPRGAIRSLAFDPSLTCTGFALCDVWDDGRMPQIALRRFGYIEPPDKAGKDDLWERAMAISEACAMEAMEASVLADMASYDVSIRLQVCAVEMPMTQMGGVKEARSSAHLPGYGVVCGAVASCIKCEFQHPHRPVYAKLYCPSATLWSGGIKTGGKGKPNRIAMANMMTGMDIVEHVGKSRAENVADAILLARWAAIKHRVETGR